MNGGPMFSQRDAQPLDLMLKSIGGEGWDGVESLVNPQEVPSEYQPDDMAAMFLAGMARSHEGRMVIEWLMDITLRRPLRITGKSFEETALLCAARQGSNGVGEAVLKAIALGDRLISQRQNGASR